MQMKVAELIWGQEKGGQKQQIDAELKAENHSSKRKMKGRENLALQIW